MNDALPQREYALLNSGCVACGSDNSNGLRLQFARQSGKASADWQPDTKWESFRGVIHGGIVSTMLDEAMSQAIIGLGWEAFTAELRVRLRTRVSPTEQLWVCGWVSARRKREIWTEATLKDAAGTERAHAWGKFLGAHTEAQSPCTKAGPVAQHTAAAKSERC